MINVRKILQQRMTPTLMRRILNIYGPFFGAGIKITHFSDDWHKGGVRMKLRWYNRNYVGTQFGGSLYSMTDPHLMLMLMNILGDGYIVWDKSASIEFIKPGKGTVYANIEIMKEQVEEIKAATANGRKHLPTFTIDVVDDQGKLIAKVEKELYVRLKRDRHNT